MTEIELSKAALSRLNDHVQGCEVEVPEIVFEGAGRSVAIISTHLDPAVIPASIGLLAAIVNMTYRAGYMHGRSDVIRESN